jgi:hypothetical protein
MHGGETTVAIPTDTGTASIWQLRYVGCDWCTLHKDISRDYEAILDLTTFIQISYAQTVGLTSLRTLAGHFSSWTAKDQQLQTTLHDDWLKPHGHRHRGNLPYPIRVGALPIRVYSLARSQPYRGRPR